MHPSWILERQTKEKNDQPITSSNPDNFNRIILDNNVETYSIGRARDNTINCVSIYVSRRHCCIKRKDDKMYIVDLGSANGTFVNKTQILPRREIPLVAGDMIGLGISEYLSKECFVYKLSKELKDDEPSCIVLSDSEEECIPQVVEERSPHFSKKRPLNSSDSVPHKVPRLSHFEIKEEPSDSIINIPSTPFSTLNSGVSCLEPTVMSGSLKSEPQIQVKTECLMDQESCTNKQSIKCKTEASDNLVSDIKCESSYFARSEKIADSNPSSLSAVLQKNEYSLEENSSTIKSELNISENIDCSEKVIHEYQTKKHFPSDFNVHGSETIKVEENLNVGVCSNEKIKIKMEEKLNIPNSRPTDIFHELNNVVKIEYQGEKHNSSAVGVCSSEKTKVEEKLNMPNSGPTNVFHEFNNLVIHECQTEKPKSSAVSLCGNEKIKLEEDSNTNFGATNVLHKLNDFSSTANNLPSNDICLKELRIKLERIDNVVPEEQSSIGNYTLEDDIIVISDDEELFPCSQIFDEEHVNVKQEVNLENHYSEKSSAKISSHIDLVCIEDDNIIDENGDIQNFEGVDSDDSDDNEWLTKLSQTYFNDDVKSRDGNNLNSVLACANKQEDNIENSCSIDSQEASQLIVPRHKKVKPICTSDDEDSNLPSFDKPKKIISSKPILIEAPHLKKPKRSVRTVTNKKESKTEKKVSQPLPKVSKKQQPKAAILERVLRKITNGPACIKDSHTTDTLRHRRPSSEQKSNITEERKKKLKAIAEHSKNDKKSDTKAKHATHCTKLTEKTRGEYLIESMKPTEIVQKSEIDKVADTSKKSDNNRDGKQIPLLDKKSDSRRCKSLSDLPKIPRIKNYDSSINPNLERVSPLQCSPVNVHKSYCKETVTKPSSVYKETVTNPSSMNKETVTNPSSMCSNSVISSENFSGISQPSKPLNSCLKKMTIGTQIKTSKNVSFSELNLTSVKTYEIPAGSKLIPLGSRKDAPIPKSVVTGCNSNTQVSKFLNEIIGLICHWNPKWLEEQKQKKEPPPLLNMKLYPMLTSFSSYEDYKTILVPLMIHNIWQIISTDMETDRLSRSPALIFHMEKCDRSDSNTMRIKCSAVMGPKDATTMYPKLGDLVIAEIQLNSTSLPKPNIGASQGNQGSRLFAHCFAYIERSNIERCKLDNFNNKFCSSFPSTQTKWSLILSVKCNAYKNDTPIRIKVLKYIRSDLRQFQGLAALQTSPLCDLILKPTYSTYSLPKPEINKLWTKELLNPEQKKAVLECAGACIKNDPKICLIQGPPGTGKSTVIKNLVMQILYGRNDYSKNKHRRNKGSPRILLCAPSNAGIDELIERLLAVRQTLPKDTRFKMVRVGNIKNMRGMAKEISLEELAKKEVKSTAENYQNGPESLELEFRCIEAKRKCYLTNLESSSSLSEVSRIAIQSKILALDFKMKQLEQSKNQVAKSNDQKLAEERTAQTAILQGADIVATTLNSCFTNLMESIFGPNSTSHNKFTCCIIDEATQCTEPESLIPLLHCINTLVLVGDTEQLPATIISNEAKKLGFGQSLFSRIQNCFVGQETPVHMLTVQYRMHPEICLWPNQYFYMGKLVNGPDLAEKRKSNLLPYIILSLDSVQDSFGEMKNSREAEFVKKLALSIAETNLKMRISIITPYNKQRLEIVHLLDASNHKFGSRIEVNTIDSSQGQEREVVIMSCTRTDGVGFLTKTERLNVALTRARNSLILCGNFRSLLNDGMWRSLIKNAQERKCYKEVMLSEVRSNNILQLVLKQ